MPEVGCRRKEGKTHRPIIILTTVYSRIRGVASATSEDGNNGNRKKA